MRLRDHDLLAEEALVVAERWLPAPGRVTRSEKLPASGRVDPVQRRAAASPVSHEDPFAMHLVGGTDHVHAAAAHGVSGAAVALPYLDRIQAAFGSEHDLSRIQAHVGGAAAEGSAAIGAQAYATGDHVAFASAPDLHTAAHEAAHVVQQRGGVQLAGGVGAAGDSYEQHADLVADAVVRGESVEHLLSPFAVAGGGASAVQRKPIGPPEPAPPAKVSELEALHSAIDVHVTSILADLKSVSTPDEAAGIIAGNAAMVSGLLWRIADVARKQADRDQAPVTVQQIDRQIERLFVEARRHRVDLVAAGLAPVFEAADAMLVNVGLRASDRRAAFYGDRTASDLAGAPREAGKDPGETGADLIDKIKDWFRYEPLREVIGLTEMIPILQEPPRAPEPSILERLLAAVASHVVGLLPGYLSGVLGSAVMSAVEQAQRPPGTGAGAGAGGGAPVGFPMNTDPSYRRPAPSPKPATGNGLSKYPELKLALAAFSKVAPAVGEHVATPLIKAGGEAAEDSVAPAGPGKGGSTSGATKVKNDRRPLATAFVTHVGDGLAAYVNKTVAQVAGLAQALELLPPAALAVMYEKLVADSQEIAAKIRVDLVAEWASFIAAASQGEDKAGNLANHGTLQDIVEKPGVVQMTILVTSRPSAVPLPRVRVESIKMNGMSESAIFELQRAARPLATAALHRVVRMKLEDAETGQTFPEGMVSFGPEHQVDLDDASWAALAQIASGHIPDSRPSEMSERIVRAQASVSRATVERTAVTLLHLANATTADIP